MCFHVLAEIKNIYLTLLPAFDFDGTNIIDVHHVKSLASWLRNIISFPTERVGGYSKAASLESEHTASFLK